MVPVIRRARRAAVLATIVAALAAVPGPAGAATKGAPFEATYTNYRVVNDVTLQGSSTATSTQSTSGSATVDASSTDTAPTGSIQDLYGTQIGIGGTEAESRAGISQAVAVGGNGTVSVALDSLSATVNASPGIYGVSGAYAAAVAEVYAFHYPCNIGDGCYADDYWFYYEALAYSYSGQATSTTTAHTFSFTNTHGAGHIVVQAGVRASTRVTGAANATSNASGRLVTITTP